MKIPAVWIAAAFAAGIVLRPSGFASAPPWILVAGIFILTGALATRFFRTLWPAGILALAAWCALGAASASIEPGAIRSDNIARLVAAGKIEPSEPLRWRGSLREDPLRLPWGARYLLEIESVESAGREISSTGGLRVNYFWKRDGGESLPALRAGDRVEVLLSARAPRNFMDAGAPDTRGILAREGVDLIGTLRSTELLQKLSSSAPTISQRLARARGALLQQIDATFAASPEVAAILRAMLLGDRMFVNSKVALEFQTTGAFHVLVLAGLHVGVLCAFLFWLGKKLRFPTWLLAIVTIAALALYLGVVQDRPPILRATLMASFFILSRPLYRRVALLNIVAVAAILLLALHPPMLFDMSFELSFLAAGSIAGLALPWIERTSERYLAGLRHLGDVPRDLSFPPKIAQFRIDLRAVVSRIARALPNRLARFSEPITTLPLRLTLRVWELFVLSIALQVGMLALLAADFHRVTLAGPASNVPAVLLTGLIVPLGFLTLGAGWIWQAGGRAAGLDRGGAGKTFARDGALVCVAAARRIPHSCTGGVAIGGSTGVFDCALHLRADEFDSEFDPSSPLSFPRTAGHPQCAHCGDRSGGCRRDFHDSGSDSSVRPACIARETGRHRSRRRSGRFDFRFVP